ncbi:MAG: four helix bundle protein [Cyanobacteria bacterium P01_H01_bin.58]
MQFETLTVWQEARELTNMIYAMTRQGTFSKDFGLRDQIERASVSCMSNIAEGYELRTRRQRRAFLYIAKGSVGEVRSQLYVALDQGYIRQDQFDQTVELATRISKRLASFIASIQS